LPKNRYREENEISEKYEMICVTYISCLMKGSDWLFVIHGCVSSQVLYGGNRDVLNVGKYDILHLLVFVLPYRIIHINKLFLFLNNYLRLMETILF
jgi:hypothetical protein